MEQKRGSRSGRYRARHAHRPRALILVAALLLLAVAGLAVFAAQLTGNISRTTAFGLKNIGELATQAGYFTTVQTISKSRDVLGIVVPGTQSNYVYSYDGVIKAGINFEELDISVDDLRHEITIRFPEFRILSTEIDDDSFTLYNDGANLPGRRPSETGSWKTPGQTRNC